ncbi:MAG: SufD family Fe-S cluster assembly protein [Thermoprotei archaeon]|nr:SufD family Fe-S cluster assembly protein [Thermoprotei archaeon]
MKTDRSTYARLVEELPYQHIADTPTVKHYTDWKVFDERLNLPFSTEVDRVPGVLSHLSFNVILGLDPVIVSRPRGVVIEALGGEAGNVEPMSLAGVHDKMSAYHAYRWRSGVIVEVEEGVDFGSMILLSLGGDAYTGHHIILNIGDEARGKIYIVDYAGPSKGLKTLVFEGIVGGEADVEVNVASLHSREHAVYTLGHIATGRRSTVASKILAAGGAMSRVQIDYIVEGEGAVFKGSASSIARPGAKMDIILNSINKGAESSVTLSGRGAVLNGGYMALRGSAIIGREARWASSEIELHVTLMGEAARGHAVPILEIHSGDVAKANHAAGISHVLEEQRFYLKSRGLSDEEAFNLLVSGIISYSELADDLAIYTLDVLNV